MIMRAAGRPSGSTVATVIAVALRISLCASSIQLFSSGSGSSGSGSGRPGFMRVEYATMSTSGLEAKFQNLHEIVKAAQANLPPGPWDYLVGGTETETTLRRNRLAIDTVAFRPRVLRNVAEVDLTTTFLGRK